jgi:hypothetical protein
MDSVLGLSDLLSRVSDPEPHCFWKLDPDPLKSKFRTFKAHKWSRRGPWTLKMGGDRLKMEPEGSVSQGRLHHDNEEQDPDMH